ncbi:MAG: di-trans,poly-cis-decaprenylcistransferase [Fimbriimonadaceae bacterium]|nr:di-trans,poly-cis-decaprenylcistransferase [Fimbriimonadaceae bacterium]QYK59673.1 MAG: di-trans,poly-cis-decaprenylcistransferase [Fimbriimonadaceae bacterium]
MAPGQPTAVQERALKAGVDLERLPRHMAVIMDGNGRWATQNGQHRLVGHREGYLALKRNLQTAQELGIGYLTVYGFSVENWRRPETEVAGLMTLIEEAARTELRGLIENNVRVLVAGRLHELPTSLQEALSDLMESTSQNSGIVFTLAINYGGRAEIVDAVKALIAEGHGASAVTEEAISARLYRPELPEPDLMVRTAGEMRWSNYLLWQSAYTELFVTERAWPDFGEPELFEAVLAYQARYRKFGGL